MHAHDRRTNTRGVSLLAGAAILALVPAVLPRQTHPAPEPAPRCSRRPRRRATGCTTAAVATTPGSPPHCRSAPGAPGWSPPRPRKWKITRKTRRPGVAVESGRSNQGRCFPAPGRPLPCHRQGGPISSMMRASHWLFQLMIIRWCREHAS
jgi:hypothetical protein